MISTVKLNRFRGFKELEITGMKRLTLLSGRNNVGKSTVLESLYLFTEHANSDSFYSLNGFRSVHLTGAQNLWSPLFYNLDMSMPLRIEVEEQGQRVILEYQKNENYLPQAVSGVADKIIARFRASTREEGYALSFSYQEGEYSETGHFMIDSEGILRDIQTNLPGNEIRHSRKTVYLHEGRMATSDFLVEEVGQLELEGRKQDILDILREVDPDVKDIITVVRQNISQLHIRTENGWIPLQYMGDGIMRLLTICLSVMKQRNGLVLIDEIETGFHYSMYKKLWKIIDRISEAYQCQIIATTHSGELIAAVQGQIQDGDQFVYYRLGKRNEEKTAYCFDYDMLEDALRDDMEVR